MRTAGPASSLEGGWGGSSAASGSSRLAATSSPSWAATCSRLSPLVRVTAPPVATDIPPSAGVSRVNMRAMGTPSPLIHARQRTRSAEA